MDIKATVTGHRADKVAAVLEKINRAVRRRFGAAVFGEGGETLESAVGAALLRSQKTLAVAESCTGGLVAQKITSVPGSSAWFWGGVVSYADAAKQRFLDVPARVLRSHGAVSKETALAMASGLKRRSGADYALSITGIAGPTGGTAQKPVGLVFIGLAGPRGTQMSRHIFIGDRASIRDQSALWSLWTLLRRIRQVSPPNNGGPKGE